MSLFDSDVASKAERQTILDNLERLRRKIESSVTDDSDRSKAIREYHRVLDIWVIPSGVDDGTLSPKAYRPRLIDHRQDRRIRRANQAYRAYEIKRSRQFMS